jgi:hypothetical protein
MTFATEAAYFTDRAATSRRARDHAADASTVFAHAELARRYQRLADCLNADLLDKCAGEYGLAIWDGEGGAARDGGGRQAHDTAGGLSAVIPIQPHR